MPKNPDPSEDSFFSRWSQRKQQALQPDTASEDLPSDPVDALDAGAPAPDALPITEEELAALPAIEDLTAQSDIRAFMRAGVPKTLRSAALRKMWMITPAIRDHVDPAVDYAWDWNTPGGVPGDGPAPSAESAAKMMRDLFKPRQAKEADVADGDGMPDTEIAEAAELPDGANPGEDATAALQDAPAVSSEPGAQPPSDRPRPAAPKPAEAPKAVAAPPVPKRHGGALPS